MRKNNDEQRAKRRKQRQERREDSPLLQSALLKGGRIYNKFVTQKDHDRQFRLLSKIVQGTAQAMEWDRFRLNCLTQMMSEDGDGQLPTKLEQELRRHLVSPDYPNIPSLTFDEIVENEIFQFTLEEQRILVEKTGEEGWGELLDRYHEAKKLEKERPDGPNHVPDSSDPSDPVSDEPVVPTDDGGLPGGDQGERNPPAE